MYVLVTMTGFPSIQYGFLTHDFPSHSHDVWEIHLFTGGQGTLLQEDRTWSLAPGTVTLSPPGVTHELTVDGTLSFYYLQFHGEKDLIPVLRRLVERQGTIGPQRVNPASVAEVGGLKVRLDSRSPDRVASGWHGFRAWLYNLAAGEPETEPDAVDKVMVWLRGNLNRRLELDDLASVAGLDRFAFSRRFKARTGLSPLAYVHRSKVEAAGFLLAGTDLPLDEVAHRFGFCDEFHFGKVFKKWRGVPPGRWRNEGR